MDRWISEFKASLVYGVSSRAARATERNPVSKKKKKEKNGNKKNQRKNKTKGNRHINIKLGEENTGSASR